VKIALIKFMDAGKKYYFKFDDININVGDLVLVETVLGVEIGEVTIIKDKVDIETSNVLKPILRIANDEDINKYNKNIQDSIQVLSDTKSLVKKHKLDMELLKAEYTLDRERLIIYFKAEQRVDFRELVRDLSSIYQTRIELRQLGPRDIAKMVGGIGPCGLLLCCSTFIGEFEPVSINMAKNQELSLNPTNISGICGRLLCCLKYEDEVYEELKEEMPDLFDIIHTNKGKGKVLDINFLENKIKIGYDNKDFSPEWIDYSKLKSS